MGVCVRVWVSGDRVDQVVMRDLLGVVTSRVLIVTSTCTTPEPPRRWQTALIPRWQTLQRPLQPLYAEHECMTELIPQYKYTHTCQLHPPPLHCNLTTSPSLACLVCRPNHPCTLSSFFCKQHDEELSKEQDRFIVQPMISPELDESRCRCSADGACLVLF